MPTSALSSAALADAFEIRRAGGGVLSLALLDARNHTLDLLARWGDALEQPAADDPAQHGLPPPLWTAGHMGWFQERWIGRNPQRALGQRCDPTATPLGSIEAHADAWWDPAQSTVAERWQTALPGIARVRAYLLDVLEGTLSLLDKTPDTDAALYAFRLALFHEDHCSEQLVRSAQARGVALPLPQPQVLAARPPVVLPATRWTLGLPDDAPGFAWDEEMAVHGVDVPESEIDALPVNWAQFVEFVDDSGYDRQELWQPAGWSWLQRAGLHEGRRAPRHVTQIGVASGAVLQTRFGQPVRLAAAQPVMHLSWWEADAWCRWAGRRLPTEVEWELAACTAGRRGFHWGDAWEWTASTLHPYPGYRPGPAQALLAPFWGHARVLRGASFAPVPVCATRNSAALRCRATTRISAASAPARCSCCCSAVAALQQRCRRAGNAASPAVVRSARKFGT